jgi:hypothetical protein
VLTVRSERREARLAIVEGTPRAVAVDPSDDDTLGDTLDRLGALDHDRHVEALERGPPSAPVGAWLVESGVTTRPALAHALRIQLKRRVTAIFTWPLPELAFRAGHADVGVAPLAEPVSSPDLVLGAMRALVAEVDPVSARQKLGDGLLVLTRLGEALLRDAALGPEESAMVALLRHGAPVDVALARLGHGARAIRALHALRLLGAVAPPSAGQRYSMLLRKQRQLRRAADARALLEIGPRASPEEARRALRRLAHVVHPDRFGAAEDAAVRSASREVMTALVDAQRRLEEG